jgi:large repetitive protein
VLLGVLLAVAAAVTVAVTGALAAPTVAPPTITGSPANPTASTSAPFTFTGAPSGGSYQCSLDAAAFATCTSPKTYTGIATGTHTFRVSAVDKNNKMSDPASFTWTVDATPPTVSSIARAAASPTNASSVQWTVTFSEPVNGVDPTDFALVKTGITGGSSTVTVTGSGAGYTATMASTGSGDGSVGLNLGDNDSIKDALNNPLGGTGNGNGNFTGQVYTIDRTPPTNAPTITSGPSGLVNSSSATFVFTSAESGVAGFRCQIDAGPVTVCSSPATFSGLPDGSRTFTVRAADAAGNVGVAAATRSWTIDTVPPPLPVLGTRPDDPNGDGIANFDWTNAESPVTYQCSLENKPFFSCTSPYRSIVDVSNDGQHQFAVRAFDLAGNFSTTFYSWKVLHAVNVVVDGNAVGLLYPGGPAREIALTLHNPNNFPVTITIISATVSASPAGCSAATNVDLLQSNVGNGTNPQTVTVAANTNLTIPSALRPTIRLVETGLNQQACKNGIFTLSYLAKGSK